VACFKLLESASPCGFRQQPLARLPLKQHAWQEQKEFPCPYCVTVRGCLQDTGASQGQCLPDSAPKELRRLLEKKSFLKEERLQVNCVEGCQGSSEAPDVWCGVLC